MIDLYENNKGPFQKYADLLLSWNQKINLTAITDPQQIIERHFIDSLFVVPVIEKYVSRETISLLDIGAGAGFPGLPLKIALPSLSVTLVDSVRKKCDFMKEVARRLGLKDVTVLHHALSESEPVGRFDVIVSRAAFKMPDLIRLAAPNLNSGGILIAMKGLVIESELEAAESLRISLGLSPFKKIPYQLPFSGLERVLVTTCST